MKSKHMFFFILIPCLILLFATPGMAVTYDEISAMQDAGIPIDIIIDVIDATGLDDELDLATYDYLVETGLDGRLLEYILALNYIDPESSDLSDTSDPADSLEGHWNYYGGEGFNHGGNASNPLGDRDRDSRYPELYNLHDPYWSVEDYISGYTTQSGIYIYTPPVYIMGNHPYRAYYSPRYHDSHPYPYYAIIPDSYDYTFNYCDPWNYPWYGVNESWYRSWYVSRYRGHHYRDFGSSFNVWLGDDDWGLRISF